MSAQAKVAAGVPRTSPPRRVPRTASSHGAWYSWLTSTPTAKAAASPATCRVEAPGQEEAEAEEHDQPHRPSPAYFATGHGSPAASDRTTAPADHDQHRRRVHPAGSPLGEGLRHGYSLPRIRSTAQHPAG